MPGILGPAVRDQVIDHQYRNGDLSPGFDAGMSAGKSLSSTSRDSCIMGDFTE